MVPPLAAALDQPKGFGRRPRGQKLAFARDGTTVAAGLDGHTRQRIGLVLVESRQAVVRDPRWAESQHAAPSDTLHAVADHAAALADLDAVLANSRHEIVGDDARREDFNAYAAAAYAAAYIEHHVGPHAAAGQRNAEIALDHAELFDHGTFGDCETDARLKVGDRAVAQGDRELSHAATVLVPHPEPGAVAAYRVPLERSISTRLAVTTRQSPFALRFFVKRNEPDLPIVWQAVMSVTAKASWVKAARPNTSGAARDYVFLAVHRRPPLGVV